MKPTDNLRLLPSYERLFTILCVLMAFIALKTSIDLNLIINSYLYLMQFTQ